MAIFDEEQIEIFKQINDNNDFEYMEKLLKDYQSLLELKKRLL